MKSKPRTTPADAWKNGRAATVPVAAAWVGAAGAVLNTTTDITPGSTGSLVLAGVTVTATAATALGAWGKHLVEKERGLPGMNLWQGTYVTGCACAAGTWVTWAAATLPYGPWTAGAFAAGTLAAWLLYPWYRYSRRHVIAANQAAAEPAPDGGPGTDWEQILEDAAQKGVREKGDRIETPGGYLIRLHLPENGRVTYHSLVAAQDRIAVIAGRRLNLRTGGIRFEEQPNPADVLMHITTRDVLAELIPLPHNMELIDSNRPFTIGLYEDGTPMEWAFDAHGMVVGMTDSGKSNFLNVLIKHAAQMVDTLTFVIDPKGGRLARPWVQPHLDGKIQRPILDWVATSSGPRETDDQGVIVGKAPSDYYAILKFACDEIDRRAGLGLGGVEKATTTPDLPRIVVIVDEVTDVTSVSELRGMVEHIVRKGRSEGVIAILAGQRGTVTMFGSGDLKSQIKYRAGLGVTSQTDANTVFPNNPKVGKILTKLAHPGTVLVQLGPNARALPGKTFRIEPGEHIEPLAVALSGRRPALPQDAAHFHGDAYTGRWEPDRIRHLYATTATKAPDMPTPAPRKQPEQPSTPGESSIGSTAKKLGLPPSRILNQLGIGKPKNTDHAAGDDLSPEGRKLADATEAFLAQHAPQPEPEVDERRRMVRRLVFDAGRQGVETRDLFEALRRAYGDDWNRSVVQTWLSDDVRAGRMHRPARGRYAHGPNPEGGEKR